MEFKGNLKMQQLLFQVGQDMEPSKYQMLNQLKFERFLQLLLMAIVKNKILFPEIIFCIIKIKGTKKEVGDIKFKACPNILIYVDQYIEQKQLCLLITQISNIFNEQFNFLDILSQCLQIAIEKIKNCMDRLKQLMIKADRILCQERFTKEFREANQLLVERMVILRLMGDFNQQNIPRCMYLLDQNVLIQGSLVVTRLLMQLNLWHKPLPEIILCLKFCFGPRNISFILFPKKVLLQVCLKDTQIIQFLQSLEKIEYKSNENEERKGSQRNYIMIVNQLQICLENRELLYGRLVEIFKSDKGKNFVKSLKIQVEYDGIRSAQKGKMVFDQIKLLKDYVEYPDKRNKKNAKEINKINNIEEIDDIIIEVD